MALMFNPQLDFATQFTEYNHTGNHVIFDKTEKQSLLVVSQNRDVEDGYISTATKAAVTKCSKDKKSDAKTLVESIHDEVKNDSKVWGIIVFKNHGYYGTNIYNQLPESNYYHQTSNWICIVWT